MLADMMLQVGDQFDHFEIQSHLARGGMSDIYRAHDLANGQEVVLKIPDATVIGDPAQFERFQREMDVMEALHHPSIQKGLGSGQYNRTPYLVTEPIEGQSLREVISARAPLPPDEALALIRKIADGLAYCHDHDVVHRDLKPENILITPAGQPIIMDFGLALTKGGHRVTYANLSATAGTPEYMSPEQVEGKRGDPRTDLYALGVIFYEILAGHPPFHGDNPLAVMAQHVQDAIPRLDHERPGVSPQLAAVVARCLQRDPEARYPDMRALIADLDHLDQVDTSILERATGPQTARPWWRSQTAVAVGVGLAIVAGLGVLGVALQALHGLGP